MNETAQFLDDGRIFSIVTRPDTVRSKVAIVLLNAGLINTSGPYRLNVEIARRAAELGYVAVRIDQSNKGESETRKGLSARASEVADFDAVAKQLGKLGIDEFVIGGLCSAADDSLRIATNKKEIAGLLMLDGYARKTAKFRVRQIYRWVTSKSAWKKLFRIVLRRGKKDIEEETVDVRDWDKPSVMINRYRALLQSGTKALAVFSGGVPGYYNYEGQLSECLNLGSDSDKLTEVYFRNFVHIYPSVAQQRKMVEIFLAWLKVEFPFHGDKAARDD